MQLKFPSNVKLIFGFILDQLIRCSTPFITMDACDDTPDTQCTKPKATPRDQGRKHTPPKPIGCERKLRIPVETSTEDFTQCFLLNATLNRIKAEMNRQRVFGSIFVGPISNVGKTR